MIIRARFNSASLAFPVILAISNFTWVTNGNAEEVAPQPASITSALQQKTGKQAKIKLVSGQDIEGKVQNVGTEVVVIAELTGMEFFSATVRIDQIAAVISRTETP